ncbi:MAG: ABC transporter permease [Candidatus Pacearchaeota archaeon]
MAIGTIIKKSLHDIIKSKLALFALFVLPAIIILVLCFSLNTAGLQNIRVAYSMENLTQNSLNTTLSLLELLKNKGYEIINSSAENCIENIKKGGWHICLIIRQGKTERELNIEIYTDASRINLAYALINHISHLIQIRSEELSISLIQAIIAVLDATKSNMNDAGSKLKELNKIVLNINAATSNIKAIANAIDTSFNLNDFKIDKLDELIEELGNSSNLTSDFEDIASHIEAKLKETQKKFLGIESKKAEIKSYSEEIVKLGESILLTSDKVRDITSKVNSSIDEIKEKNPEVLTSPIKTSVISVTTKTKNLDFVLPGFLTFILVSLALFVSSSLTIKEKKSKAYFRNFLTPISDLSFVTGYYFSFFIILAIEMALALLIISFFTDLFSGFALLNIVPILVIALSIFAFLGIFIGHISKSEEIAILINFFILLFFFFFSQTILPHEMLKPSPTTNKILAFSPFNIIEDSLKRIIFFKFPIGQSWFNLLILFAYTLIFFAIAVLSKKLTKHTLIYS